MTGPVILFGVGSPVIGDVEESLYRAGVPLAAGIQNVPGISHLSADARLLRPEELDETHLGLPFLVPLFTPAHRQQAARKAASHGLDHPFTLVDPSAIAPRRFALGPGGYVNAGSSFGVGCNLGAFAFINRSSTIGHHVSFGDFVSIGPGVTVAGLVTIGTGSVVGAGATILPSVRIGENAVIGGGAVVVRDVPPRCLVLGNPARVVRRDIGGYKGLAVE